MAISNHFQNEISVVVPPITLPSNPLATTQGSNVVTVTLPLHGLSVGSYIALMGVATTIGGILATDLNKMHQVTAVIDVNKFQITVVAPATSTVVAGGSVVTAQTDKVLVYIVDETYDEFAWSYNGLECRGGSELACEYAAGELLEAMGFRWYTPQEWGTVRPTVIPTGLSGGGPTTSFWFLNGSSFLVYGHSWPFPLNASTTYLNNGQAKWERLNCIDVSPWPAGHRWGGVILENREFFQEYPEMIQGGAAQIDTDSKASSAHFDLAAMALNTDLYDMCVHMCAATLLNGGLNAWNRTHFDPSDGDNNPSDLVYPFTKAVADLMRVGVTSIGDQGAHAGVPDAMIGIYAYANHRLPPELPYGPAVYTQVALAFNSTALSYTQLIEGHGAKAAAVSLREYLDTQTWSDSKPFVQGMNHRGFAQSRYPTWRAAGAVAIHTENSANYLVNLVGMRAVHRFWKDGVTHYDDALNDVMDKLFDNDPGVRALYTLWSNGKNVWNNYNLRRSFDCVAQMIDGTWYRTYYEYLLTILADRIFLPPKLGLTEQVPYWKGVLKLTGGNPAKVTVNVADIGSFTNGMTVMMEGAAGLHQAVNGPKVVADLDPVAGTFTLRHTFTLDNVDTTGAPEQLTSGTYPIEVSVDPFAGAYNEVSKKVVAVRELDIMHSYAWIRQDNNSAANNYRRLKYSQTPPKTWARSTSYAAGYLGTILVDGGVYYRCIKGHVSASTGTFAEDRAARPDLWQLWEGALPDYPDYMTRSRLPTGDEFDARYAQLLELTAREAVLDDTDLVVVNGIVPESGASGAVATGFVTIGRATYLFVGPGSVTIGANVTAYGPGLHYISINGSYLVSWSGGKLFLDTFPQVRKDPGASGSHYLYIQKSVEGDVSIRAGARVTVYDDLGRLDILNSMPPTEPRLLGLGPGHIRVDNGNTRGDMYNNNVNRYLSPYSSTALMPRPLVEQEFPADVPKLVIKHPVSEP